MNRRQFFALAAAVPVVAALPFERRVFLPPRGGWWTKDGPYFMRNAILSRGAAHILLPAAGIGVEYVVINHGAAPIHVYGANLGTVIPGNSICGFERHRTGWSAL